MQKPATEMNIDIMSATRSRKYAHRTTQNMGSIEEGTATVSQHLVTSNERFVMPIETTRYAYLWLLAYPGYSSVADTVRMAVGVIGSERYSLDIWPSNTFDAILYQCAQDAKPKW